ncbi:MAG: DUF1640 domain-containing protein [Magnetococcales bacterium]|nr:DUF1640 domain-containing protein [Magnetococcales bacterium]MBF0321977.1 DUF1640 domain-containing protein [Magnetococcales bacterium]
MTTITSDTLKFVRRLKDAGIPENQAEAISEAFKGAHESRSDELATKEDLLDVRRDLKELELRMTIKLGAMLLAVVGLVVTANRLWPIPVQYVSAPHASQEMRLPPPAR